ncbi:DNA polymerase III subunit delta [Candidatus Hepatincola sp. Pdp]
MKLQPKQIPNFLKTIPINTTFILIYGVDNGLVREYSQHIKKQYLGTNFETSQLIYLSTTILKEKPNRLQEEAFSIPLFGDNKKLIILENAKDSLTSLLKEYLNKPDDSTLIIAQSDELTPSSSLRKLAESTLNNVYAIACYKDSQETINTNIQNTLTNQGYKIANDALILLTSYLGNDRAITTNEIEKIMLYTAQHKYIEMHHVETMVANNSDIAIDKLIYSLFLKQPQKAYELLESLLNDFNPIIIVRSLVNHTLRLLQVQNELQKGNNYDSIIANLKPPIFFMNKAPFKQQVYKWHTNTLEQLLDELNTLEIQTKSKASIASLLLKNFILRKFSS